MGAKTALLAFTDGDLRPALRGVARPDSAEVIGLVRELHPDYEVTPIGEGSVGDYSYPPDDTSYVAVVAGAELFCDRRLVCDLPSRLPARLLQAGAGRRIIMHAMHSSSDWFAFAVWENGELIRSLSLSPDAGVGENIGEPYDFELPYWAGEHPVEPFLSEESVPSSVPPAGIGWAGPACTLRVHSRRSSRTRRHRSVRRSHARFPGRRPDRQGTGRTRCQDDAARGDDETGAPLPDDARWHAARARRRRALIGLPELRRDLVRFWLE
ncbi:hypothetical protein B0I29_108245 [Actinoplanes lutulentus]|uniref:Uncharacterized protein n=1 Tax=Actinoplanes lutulentus TaxID=1287878 RepID=A0A327ZCH2_9ACTN|nr:hypothetical protein B0I29_108245 [Actinoplanes lutulentus]